SGRAPRRRSTTLGTTLSRSKDRCRACCGGRPFADSFLSATVKGRAISEKFPEQAPQAAGYPPQCAGADRRARRFRREIPIRVQGEPHRRRKRRAVYMIGQAADAGGTPPANREIENLLGHLRHAVENRATAGEDDARIETLLVAGAPDLVPDEMEDFFSSRLQ